MEGWWINRDIYSNMASQQSFFVFIQFIRTFNKKTNKRIKKSLLKLNKHLKNGNAISIYKFGEIMRQRETFYFGLNRIVWRLKVKTLRLFTIINMTLEVWLKIIKRKESIKIISDHAKLSRTNYISTEIQEPFVYNSN